MPIFLIVFPFKFQFQGDGMGGIADGDQIAVAHSAGALPVDLPAWGVGVYLLEH